MQRALLQFKRPQNFPLVRQALRQAGREDLIGTGRSCLVPPEGVKTAAEYAQIRREKKAREERREMREHRGTKPVPKGKADMRNGGKNTAAGKTGRSAGRKPTRRK